MVVSLETGGEGFECKTNLDNWVTRNYKPDQEWYKKTRFMSEVAGRLREECGVSFRIAYASFLPLDPSFIRSFISEVFPDVSTVGVEDIYKALDNKNNLRSPCSE